VEQAHAGLFYVALFLRLLLHLAGGSDLTLFTLEILPRKLCFFKKIFGNEITFE